MSRDVLKPGDGCVRRNWRVFGSGAPSCEAPNKSKRRRREAARDIMRSDEGCPHKREVERGGEKAGRPGMSSVIRLNTGAASSLWWRTREWVFGIGPERKREKTLAENEIERQREV
jgi:hypothetical protein